MLQKIQKFFNNNLANTTLDGGETSEHALQLAAAALLMEMAHADDYIDETELVHILEVVRGTFSLTESEAAELVDLAHAEAESSASLHEFTALINAHWSADMKLQLVELMWQVAYADLEIDKHEQHLMRKIVGLLYIPHRDYIAAKMRAKHLILG
ncbi:MAG: TerB family tellurite resistance protein [Gammaproteobacteria bacterium]|nr:TerB family tellurite resistance protein [Gammaproteobacteria bacterium]MDH3466658.1 TerB family tellurite resistance protein [Gammaproteobacteria bacterium]